MDYEREINPPTVFITGFEPYGDLGANHSWDVANGVAEVLGKDAHNPVLLSVDEKGSRYPGKLIMRGETMGMILLGIAPKRRKICLEYRAKNEFKMNIKDNTGRKISDKRISIDGPDYIISTVDKSILSRFADQHDGVELSMDCGGFVCNETYFRTLLVELEDSYSDQLNRNSILFIHLPPVDAISLPKQIEVVSELCTEIFLKPEIEVVGALIRDNLGRVLACRRPPGDPWEGWWEFPGGKISEGENQSDAIIREVREELGLIVEPSKPVANVVHEYQDKIVNLTIFECHTREFEKIELLAHDKFVWLPREQLNGVKWLPADQPIIRDWMDNGIP